ncbi:hypothetical protein HU200_003886 [Digitaria exilis]|uniref:Cupin type-1 domain-containing protein n=1 Tax=Digitaria exilis TaxID=1010633 RepID=A0A835FUU3_9POAL|nr:hypothetical protein HU200_003886 [Digitaria exilis]
MAGASARWLALVLLVAVAAVIAAAEGNNKHERWGRMSGRVGGQVVEKERRRAVAETEAGRVTAVDVADAAGTAYRLHFITMDPGALFLPVQLHADMVFYVHSGRGKVTYIEEESGEQSSLEVERGDVYNLEQGSILYIQSYPNATRQRLRIYAIFTSEGINAEDPSVQREVAEAIKSAKIPPSIIPYNPHEKGHEDKPNWTEDIVDALLGVRDPEDFLNKMKKKDKDKKSKSKAFNFYSGKPDVHNCYGWSKTMTNKDLDALHGSNIGMFMVNLTTGSMMGPHWNPKATEIAIVTAGSGIVQTVCPSSNSSKSRRGRHGDKRRGPGGRGDDEGKDKSTAQCRSSVFRVKEGDVFVVPRFHPMAQMSFNNDSFVFVGFSTHMGQNHPQFLAGKGSELQAIGKEVLALSLGHMNSSAVEKLLSAQRDSTILSCISCAEELEGKAAAEEERRRREEEEGGGGKGPGEREEEERKRREQEERERKEREEEERRKKEERERKEREEEERRREEEERERKKEEERQRKKEEERERKEEEERQRRKEEERERREQEEQQREEEEERARREEEERQREEEERRRKEEEEEGGGGRGDEPEREEEEETGDERPYWSSKKLKHHHRFGMFRSG